MQDEIWKDIEGYEGLYQVSNWGNIRSFKIDPSGRLLKMSPTAHGYAQVALYKTPKDYKQIRVHRLVYMAFVGEIPSNLEINHKDGCKRNNYIDNLEAVTRSENAKHAWRTGLQARRYGSVKKVFYAHKTGKRKRQSINIRQQFTIRRLYDKGNGVLPEEIASMFKVSVHVIEEILRRER